jgi:hypothetical protein
MKGMMKEHDRASKERDPAGKVLHDRDTSSKPSPPAGIENERHENVRGAQEGGSRAEAAGPGRSHIGHAVEELHRQHPHHHSEGGVHHTTDHIRHERAEVKYHGHKD